MHTPYHEVMKSIYSDPFTLTGQWTFRGPVVMEGIEVVNITKLPTSIKGRGKLVSLNGALWWVGSAGTATLIAPA